MGEPVVGITVREAGWPDLVQAATFEEMRGQAEWVVPNQGGILKEPAAFFRHGRSGAGRQLLTDDEMAAYEDRVADLAPSAMLDVAALRLIPAGPVRTQIRPSSAWRSRVVTDVWALLSAASTDTR